MDCIYCKYQETIVLDTKQDHENHQTYRRRKCTHCLKRFTTREHLRDNYERKRFSNAEFIRP